LETGWGDGKKHLCGPFNRQTGRGLESEARKPFRYGVSESIPVEKGGVRMRGVTRRFGALRTVWNHQFLCPGAPKNELCDCEYGP